MDEREEVRSVDEHLKDDEDVELPGFRFHPTDEELVSFYLRRKLDRKPISIELIKQIDIYKYDPWDLPKASGTGGDQKEWYFYCRRGRKYRNSIRPNRVTGSGFWKATGIDKPVYSHGGEGCDCIGLKKTLVYYRGSAGKGTKTDWMMHEFRLPPTTTTTKYDTTTISHQAEIWTLCRIFKRSASQRKCRAEWSRRNSIDKGNISMSSSTVESCNSTITNNNNNNNNQEAYINFGGSHEQEPVLKNYTSNYNYHDQRNYSQLSPSVAQQQSHLHQSTAPSSSSSSSALTSFWINQASSNDLFAFENSWDELGSVLQFPLHSYSMM